MACVALAVEYGRVRPPKKLRPCARAAWGCRKPAVQGEDVCFDHIDPALLDAAIAEQDDAPEPIIAALDALNEALDMETATAPAHEEREEEATDMAKAKDEDLKCPSCGRTFGHGPASRKWHALHVATCKGPVGTSGRIAAATRATKSAKRTAVPRRKKRHVRTPSAKVSRIAQVDVVAPISPVAFLAALRAERSKIDAAIAAVEALA